MVSSFITGAGPEWQYDMIFYSTHPNIVPLGYYYRYPNFLCAQFWVGMHSIRMELHETIRLTLLDGFSAKPPIFTSVEHTAQYQISTELLLKLQSELLASIPQYLLAPDASDRPTTKFPWSNFRSRTSTSVSADIPLIRLFGGYGLPWVLYKVGESEREYG
jgi:hypothetical protein